MAYLSKKASSVLVSALATCGGDGVYLFEAISEIAKKETGDLWGMIPKGIPKDELGPLKRIEKEAEAGEITAHSVLRFFGRPEHFREMKEMAKSGVPSIASELSPEIRAVLHTLLPVTKDGVYANEGRIITLKGLVPLGPQEGNLVAHLAGIFSSGCTKEELEALLALQANDSEFMKDADRVGEFDYSGTKLREVTIRAKKKLGL